MNEEKDELELLTQEQVDKIKAEHKKLMAEGKYKKLYPIVVCGSDYDEKEFYYAFFRKPTLSEFSKTMSIVKRDETMGMRALARDCFVAGDKELMEDEDIFLYGAMGQLSGILEPRQGQILNFSKTGK